MSKARKIFEFTVIGLFIAIVASLVSICAYRAIIASDWYDSLQIKKNFLSATEKLWDESLIDNIGISDDDAGIEYFFDFDGDIFSDLSCDKYERLKDEERIREIYRSDWVTVFFKDGSQMSFFVTEDLRIYWGATEVTCPSLLEWYKERR